MIRAIATALALLAAPALAGEPEQRFGRPVSTYSIVARDAETGRMGVAVQSHWFSVGSIVTWGEAGVGVVATQSLADVRYGPMGLELMRTGYGAQRALDAVVTADDASSVRQVGMIDAQGRVAAHTGDRCIAYASHVTGALPDGSVYACQGEPHGRPRGARGDGVGVRGGRGRPRRPARRRA